MVISVTPGFMLYTFIRQSGNQNLSLGNQRL